MDLPYTEYKKCSANCSSAGDKNRFEGDNIDFHKQICQLSFLNKLRKLSDQGSENLQHDIKRYKVTSMAIQRFGRGRGPKANTKSD